MLLNPQNTMGLFALLTFILAVTVVGHLLGLAVGDAFYLAALLVVGLVSLLYRRQMREE